MNGKDYLEYKRMNQIHISKNVKNALPYFICCFLGVCIITLLIIDIVPTQKPEPIFDNWYGSIANVVNYDTSWNAIGKVIVIYSAPFLLLTLCISWIIHGVGFYIVR